MDITWFSIENSQVVQFLPGHFSLHPQVSGGIHVPLLLVLVQMAFEDA